MRVLILMMFFLASSAAAKGEQAGDFDYYVMALSWSPNWCQRVGDARGASQCAADTGHGWVLHGVWPQYETGWPSYCPTPHDAPDQSTQGLMLDIMPDKGLIKHQWGKHGSCTAMTADEYFTLSRRAYFDLTYPDNLQMHSQTKVLSAADVEAGFMAANPDLNADQVTVTCRDGGIHEVRICLDKGLNLRSCGADVIRDCTLIDAFMAPIR